MKRILIIDDNDDYRKMLKIYLEKEGYGVDEADNGISGCRKCFEKLYGLVIVDLFLPGKDGVEVIHELKEEFSSDIKIIAVSGVTVSSGMSEYVFNQSEEHGADYIYKKGDKLKVLLNQIKYIYNLL